jgi:hypothetical protein
MRPHRLIWNFVWRGSLHGLGAGAILGAGLGALAGGMLIWSGLAMSAGATPVPLVTQILGTVIAGVYALGLSVGAGAVLGSLFGFLIGTCSALIIGTLTRVAFVPLSAPWYYRRIITLAGTLLSMLGTTISLGLVLSLIDLELLRPLILVPALIVGWYSWRVSHHIAEWYIRSTQVQRDGSTAAPPSHAR